jgi:NhaA family Na+:H+ antiporter
VLLQPPTGSRPEHALGDPGAPVVLVEYGSFSCPSCHAAEEVIGALRERFGERLRYVFRHRPLTGSQVARRAAELAEVAHELGGRYWQAHDALMRQGPVLRDADLDAVARELDLPRPELAPEAWSRARERVERDAQGARESGARVSPTFFINGRRYDGPWDETTLAEAMLGSLGHRVHAAALDFARWAPSTGLLLLAMTLVAVALANLTPAFEAFWERPAGWSFGERDFRLSLREWINDGLLSVFFLVVGLEIKREFTIGRLASRRAAALPFAAAAGGMALPALLYLALAPEGFSAGWAIPTTTDTAFAIALVATLGARVPVELRVFLTAAVIVDDLVAIVVVAIFYSGGLHWSYLAASAGVGALLVLLNTNGVYRTLPYAVLGLALWACLHASGLHATLAGVILALVTPTRPPPNLRALKAQAEILIEHELRRAGTDPRGRHRPSEPTLRSLDAIHDRMESPAAKLLRSVEPWSSYFVLPVFALANAGLSFSGNVLQNGQLMLAIVAGLVLGKPLGMVFASMLAVRLGLAAKPAAYSWAQLCGAGALAGIGFTMSLYIAAKAFPDPADFAAAKAGIFLASLLAGAAGTALLWRAASAAARAASRAPSSRG